MTERPGAVTSGNKPLTIIGEPLAVGDSAPDFELTANDLSKVSLQDSSGKVRLIITTPSLDTGICDAQTRRFNEEAARLGENVVILTVSGEHPFNQRRWCANAGIEEVQVLSDHFDMSFGRAYGTYIKEWRLEQRAVFVINADNIITYVEYVPVIAQHVDYDAALSAVAQALAEQNNPD